jgi:hypothetical protein
MSERGEEKKNEKRERRVGEEIVKKGKERLLPLSLPSGVFLGGSEVFSNKWTHTDRCGSKRTHVDVGW